MNYLITENQLRIIITESQESKIQDKIESSYSFAKNLIKHVKSTRNLNLTFLSTWGAAMGGFIKPLSDFIVKGNFDITKEQIAVILVGVGLSYYGQNKDEFKKVYDIIKKEGLTDIFEKVLIKAEDLKTSFIRFMKSLNISFGTVTEMMHYAFLIPIIGDLQSLSMGSSDILTTSILIAKRILASEVILHSGSFLSEIINKILKKFSSTK